LLVLKYLLGEKMTSDKVIAVEKISFKDAVEIAKKGTHCGMCRFDFFLVQVYVLQVEKKVLLLIGHRGGWKL